MLLSTVPGVDDHRGYSFGPFDDLHVGGAEDFQSYYVSASPLNDSRRAQQAGPPLVTAMSGKLHRHGECRRAGALWVGNGSEHGERQCCTLSMFEVDKTHFKSGQHGVNHIRLAAASVRLSASALSVRTECCRSSSHFFVMQVVQTVRRAGRVDEFSGDWSCEPHCFPRLMLV
ncbi:unnamed protein product [Calypogeia fissa]